jgi:hypothetical protein
MMPEAAERVKAWRTGKRRQGFRPVTLWLSRECKHELDSLAFQLRQDVSACVIEAVHHFALAQGARKTLRLDPQALQYLKEEIYADVVAHLSEQASPGPGLAPPPPSKRRARQGKGGGLPAIPPDTLAAIWVERQKHPELSWNQLGYHLFDLGIYRSKEKGTGKPTPAHPSVLMRAVERGKRQGLLS